MATRKKRARSSVVNSLLGKLVGARKSSRPEFIEPCHPTLWPSPPNGTDWIHEIKLDGYRAQSHIFDHSCQIFTRRGHDWSKRFGGLATAFDTLHHAAVFDGEIVALNDDGLPDFHFLQLAIAQPKSERLVYFAYDLLYLDGYDVREVRLLQRRDLLRSLIDEMGDQRLRLSEAFDVSGGEVFESVKKMGLEGVVSKKKESSYKSGRQQSWVKAKAIQSDTFIVVGFTKDRPTSAKVSGLYLAQYDGDRLLYAGKAETGFTDRETETLFQLLSAIQRKTSPLSVAVKKPKAHWVAPKIQVEIEFTGRTSDGHLRHPSFKGIREELLD